MFMFTYNLLLLLLISYAQVLHLAAIFNNAILSKEAWSEDEHFGATHRKSGQVRGKKKKGKVKNRKK